MKINLIHASAEKKARRMTLIVAGVFTICVGALASLGAGASYQASTKGTSVFQEVGHFLTFSDIRHLVMGGSDTADDPFATPDGRLNILLLGIGGEGHDGAQLTDTIIFGSLDLKTKRIGLVSLPRDLAFPLGGGRFEKINAVNAYAEQERPGEGAIVTAQAISKLLNVRIDRVVRIDFAGFEEFVNALGGLDITVEKSFTDSSFPTDDSGPNPYKWTTATFTKGTEHMDGHRVLTYVRSRHGTNGEGSDFARSRRQQIVLDAVRSKLLSIGTLTNPKKISDLWTSISSHLQTDLTAWDVFKLMPVALRFSDAKVTSHVLTDNPDGELIPSNVEGAFMLFPKKPDWSEIRDIAADPFVSKEDVVNAERPKERITVEIRNGTQHGGFAAQVSDKLSSLGYVISSTSNATQRGYEKTVIYDLTDGSKSDELARLKKLLDANVSSAPPTGQTVLTESGARESLTGTTTQFLIVLGDSSLNLITPYYAGTTSP